MTVETRLLFDLKDFGQFVSRVPSANQIAQSKINFLFVCTQRAGQRGGGGIPGLCRRRLFRNVGLRGGLSNGGSSSTNSNRCSDAR